MHLKKIECIKNIKKTTNVGAAFMRRYKLHEISGSKRRKEQRNSRTKLSAEFNRQARGLLGHELATSTAISLWEVKDRILLTEIENGSLIGAGYKENSSEDELVISDTKPNTEKDIHSDNCESVEKFEGNASGTMGSNTMPRITGRNIEGRKKRTHEQMVKWKFSARQAVHVLVERLDETIKGANAKDILFYGRCGSGRLGVFYYAARNSNGIRVVAILIELPRNNSRGKYHHIGIVRYVAHPGSLQGRALTECDVVKFCACSNIRSTQSCGHNEICDSVPEISTTVFNVLSKTIATRNMSEESNSWNSVIYGNRAVGTSAIWMAIRSSAWNVHMPNFIPVIESRNIKVSKVISQRLRCTSCRRINSNRGTCEHEKSVLHEIKNIEKENEATDRFYKNDEECIEKEDQCEESSNMNSKESESVRNKYESILPRRAIPCPADKQAVNDLLSAVSQRKRELRYNGMDLNESMYTAFDVSRTCMQCQIILNHDKCTVVKRSAVLHTLINGTINITVEDIFCHRCGVHIAFDGRDCAMFAATKKVICHRELMDYRVYQVCMLEGTFREAYELSAEVSKSSSAVHVRLGGPLASNRRTSSTAFSAFLSTIALPAEHILSKVFSCQKCREIHNDGSKTMRAIVMDGTATEILGNLPKFERPAMLIDSASDTTKLQYLFPPAKARGFFNLLLRSASSSAYDDYFEMKIAYQRTCDQVSRKIYPNSASEVSVEAIAVTRLLQICYEESDLK